MIERLGNGCHVFIPTGTDEDLLLQVCDEIFITPYPLDQYDNQGRRLYYLTSKHFTPFVALGKRVPNLFVKLPFKQFPNGLPTT